jgi:hypothetical protein
MKKYDSIYQTYKDLFYDLYKQKPVINYSQCGKLIMDRIKEYDEKMICEIIELYFEEEKPDKVFHLPWILSAASFNKYIGMMNKKVDPDIFNNAEEFNGN